MMLYLEMDMEEPGCRLHYYYFSRFVSLMLVFQFFFLLSLVSLKPPILSFLCVLVSFFLALLSACLNWSVFSSTVVHKAVIIHPSVSPCPIMITISLDFLPCRVSHSSYPYITFFFPLSIHQMSASRVVLTFFVVVYYSFIPLFFLGFFLDPFGIFSTSIILLFIIHSSFPKSTSSIFKIPYFYTSILYIGAYLHQFTFWPSHTYYESWVSTVHAPHTMPLQP